MTRDEIAKLLDSILDKELGDLDIPSFSDWEKIEKKYGCQLPMEFKFFIELMTEYSFPGDILNVSNGKTNGNDTIEFTYDYEMKFGGWKKELIPFYSVGNGDYFCLLSNKCPNTGVYYYSHEENNIEKDADNFEKWLNQLPAFLS
ncbi:SMI1 / KNR4 family protein [Lysinibacillus sp. FJAT-14745]|uniref:SMI1/KNR4 family protein n=1 Tax=Lysinibacillus sp. FJAT-14745 TaxID=1704289 RepID=UPI0006AB9A64|nr:SMI1/KNR4 family protein [Lysinibacillus sp. FJAT-14745]KOP63620.1 SMI1 / KNR4 family protein [Lysinibacillus sp. FJAT-14745]